MLFMRNDISRFDQTGFQARECGTSTINPVPYLLVSLVVCDEHRIEVLGFVNILQGLTIKDEC